MDRSRAIEAIRSFNRFYTNVIGVVDRHILDSPYSLTEARILWEIHHNRDHNARKIKANLSVDEGYLSRSISRLARQGLVRRKASAEDARVFKLSLSADGEKTIRELERKSSGAIESLIGLLSDEEVSTIVAHMKGIEKVLRSEDRKP